MRQNQRQQKYHQIINLADKHQFHKLIDLNNPHRKALVNMILQPLKITPELYHKSIQLTRIWLKLTHLASLDEAFVLNVMEPCKEGQMIGPLLRIYKKMMSDGSNKEKSKPKFSFNRVDYFLEKDEQYNYKIPCVQYNLFACGGAGYSKIIEDIHKEVWKDQKLEFAETKGLQVFWQSIKTFYGRHKLDGVVLWVSSRFQVIPNDSKAMQEGIEKSGMKVVDILYNLVEEMTFFENNDMFLRTGEKVSLIYFRAGSSPQYDNFWELKEKIAMSNAISIPWIGGELINQKRVQGELSKPSIMKKYLTTEEATLLTRNIAKIWDFDSDITCEKDFSRFINEVEETGVDQFILKPNAEGGKNNLFGRQGIAKLKSMTVEERKDYVVMKRINNVQVMRTVIESRPDQSQKIAEKMIDFQFSGYGAVSINEKQEIEELNVDGYWIRCKGAQDLESGIASNAAVNSFCFYDKID